MALSRGFPRVGLPTTLPCGVRTFLEEPVFSPTSAAAWPAEERLGAQVLAVYRWAGACGADGRATRERESISCTYSYTKWTLACGRGWPGRKVDARR